MLQFTLKKHSGWVGSCWYQVLISLLLSPPLMLDIPEKISEADSILLVNVSLFDFSKFSFFFSNLSLKDSIHLDGRGPPKALNVRK